MTAAPATDTTASSTAPEVRLPPPRRRTWMLCLVAAAVVAALAALLAPAPPRLSADEQGDPQLAAQLRSIADGVPVQALAAVRGTGSQVTAAAAVGRADARDGRERPMTTSTPQEIGSVTKSLTGLLLADAVARGEVAPTTTLGEVHPDADLPAEVAAITLDQLATHTSGLPSLAGPRLARGALLNVTHGNPYGGQTPDGVLEEAATTRLRQEPGEYRYSNLGASVLGHALAQRAGTPYPDLLRERVLDPLGMTSTVAAPAAPPAGAAHEVAANGAASTPWISTGGAPAGTGVWSTAEDLGRLLAAVADGTAPGLAATEPRADAGQEALRTGWGWLTFERDGRTFLLFNGQTGGGVSSVALDTGSGEWAAVTAPSTASTQTVALGLLGVDMSQPVAERSWLTLPVLVTAYLVVVLPLLALSLALRRRIRRPSQRVDRLRVLSEVLTLVAVLVVARGMGAWQVVPPAVWVLAVGVGALASGLLLARWGSMTWPVRRRGLRWTGFGAGAVIGTVVVGAVLTGTG
ncbi:serine hydrolase [Kineococcus sp. R8]|uniref:serine hydrolase domain-containing protein n=1 Tax=Kineococcus siccus TaxID=2696567 RepID=UPI001411D8EB|nr:serine hydrolase domain-containing protein [Kineococcus siccus]NAZ82551.1 serine hydrolase [Kineococcus siccus]